jgi:hypothetical protein
MIIWKHSLVIHLIQAEMKKDKTNKHITDYKKFKGLIKKLKKERKSRQNLKSLLKCS